MTTAAEQQQEPTLDSVYSACISFFSDWLQEECVKFPVSQFLASVGRTASASQSAALYSAKLATVESRDQMAANILAAAGLELNHCNKHVNATDRLAIIASPALAGHSSIAPSATEHESEQLLDKLLATLKINQFLNAMLDNDSMVSAQAATFVDSLHHQQHFSLQAPFSDVGCPRMPNDDMLLGSLLSCYECQCPSITAKHLHKVHASRNDMRLNTIVCHGQYIMPGLTRSTQSTYSIMSAVVGYLWGPRAPG